MNEIKMLCRDACQAKYEIQKLSTDQKNECLTKIAAILLENCASILSSNEIDLEDARCKGMHQGMLDRLKLDESRIQSMADGLLQIAALPDPLGQLIEEFTPPNGLDIKKVRVPLGVIGIIYESRPNVTTDAFGLCFKAGNVSVLKGGSDAIHSNRTIVACIKKGLSNCGINENAATFIDSTDRESVNEMMQMNEYIDVLIPRGGAGLIQNVVMNSRIPVIETGTGNCHIFVDATADLAQAVPIIINAKTQRIGVCNACESLLIHRDIYEQFLPVLADALREKHVEMHGDPMTCSVIPDAIPATEEDYYKEYLDYIISIKTVHSVEEAIAHINEHNTKHSDAILTQNEENATKFLNEVDSACVYVNASTRFTDGFEFGFGGEIGISTQKIHARGPMGLRELTTYKYQIRGNGAIRR